VQEVTMTRGTPLRLDDRCPLPQGVPAHVASDGTRRCHSACL